MEKPCPAIKAPKSPKDEPMIPIIPSTLKVIITIHS